MSSQTQLAAPTGFAGSVRKSLIGWFYPDVHDASENLGEGLEARYDKETKRWIFPGETPDQQDPSLAPPPTTAMLKPNTSANSMASKDHGSGFSLDSAAGTGSGIASTNSSDSLASLMAPPPRNISMSPVGSSDALSSMMNPPDRRPTLMMTPEPIGGGASNPNVRIWSPLPSASSLSKLDTGSKMDRGLASSLASTLATEFSNAVKEENLVDNDDNGGKIEEKEGHRENEDKCNKDIDSDGVSASVPSSNVDDSAVTHE